MYEGALERGKTCDRGKHITELVPIMMFSSAATFHLKTIYKVSKARVGDGELHFVRTPAVVSTCSNFRGETGHRG